MSIEISFTSRESKTDIKKIDSLRCVPQYCTLGNKCDKINNYDIFHCNKYHHENLSLCLFEQEIMKRKCYHHSIQKTQDTEEIKLIDVEHRGKSCSMKICKKGTDCKYLSIVFKNISVFNCSKQSQYLRDCYHHLTTYSHPETRETYYMRINRDVINNECRTIVDSLNLTNKSKNNLIQIDNFNRFSKFDYLSDIYRVTLIFKKVNIHVGKVLNGYKVAFSIINDNSDDYLFEKNKIIKLIESIDKNIKFFAISTKNEFQKIKYSRIEINGKFRDIFGMLNFISQNL